MNTQKTAALIAVYGAVLIILGAIYLVVSSFGFDIAAISCLVIGLVSLGATYFMLQRVSWSFWLGLISVGIMVMLMGWQTVVKLHHFIDMIQNDKVNSPYGAGHAFVIVLTAFLMSLFVGAIEVMLARSNARELTN